MATRKVVPKKATTKKSPRVSRRDPTISIKVVDELPDTHTSHTERATRYARAMREVRKRGVTGKWAGIATFDGANGAASVKRAILRGERQIDGELRDWAIESRRVRNDVGEIVGSELYVQLLNK